MPARPKEWPLDVDSVPRRVLDAATRLFAQQGYEATSVQQIVEAAGVTKGAMYHYFRSKDDLLAGSYGQLLNLQFDHLVEYAGQAGPVPERLRLIAEDLVRTTLAQLDSAIVFQRSLNLLSDPSRAAFREQRHRYREIFEELVREGIEIGELRDDLQIDLVSYSFFGAVGYLTVWYSPDGPRTADEIATGYADLLLATLTPPGA